MANQSFPWNTVNTLVGDHVVPNVRPQIYQSNALLKRLHSRKKGFPGGRQIQQPLLWRRGSSAQWFTGTQPLNMPITDTVQMATTTPRSFAVPIVVAWTDEMTVRGKTAIMSLVEQKGEQAKMDGEDALAGDLYNDGSDATRLTGLQYIFKAFTGAAPGVLPAQTYLGIPRQGRYDGTGVGVAPGDLIVTSGLGTLFPKGIPVGRVTAIEDKGSALFHFATLTPAVDFARVEEVLLLTGQSVQDVAGLFTPDG